jgi:hypothetical protein
VIVELEERYKIYNQPGKLRLGFFANEGRTSNTILPRSCIRGSRTGLNLLRTLSHGILARREHGCRPGHGAAGRVTTAGMATEVCDNTFRGTGITAVHWRRPPGFGAPGRSEADIQATGCFFSLCRPDPWPSQVIAADS